MHGRFDIDDDTFLQSTRRMRADTNDLNPAPFINFPNDGDDFGRSNVEPYDQVLVAAFGHSALTARREHVVGALLRIFDRRSRAVDPANRKSVAVTHVHVFDVGAASHDDVGDKVEK